MKNKTKYTALNNSQTNPSILNNNIELRQWWENLSETWKQVFLANLAFKSRNIEDSFNYFRSPWENYRKSFYSAEVIDDLTLQKIVALKEINCNYTKIKNLKPLEKLPALKELRCIGSDINSLINLENLANLEVLICFDTPLSRKERKRFLSQKPNCLILY